MTPGRLQKHLRLSSAGTTYVIDRLETAGYVAATTIRAIAAPSMRYTEQGMATAMAFFGPLGERSAALVAKLSARDQQVVHAFVLAIAASMQQQIEELDGTETNPKSARGRRT